MQTDPFHRFAELGAGHALPVTNHPKISAPVATAQPTETLFVDGVELAPAARLTALAAIRDRHRAETRAANDKMHTARERADDCRQRGREAIERYGRGSAEAQAEATRLEGEAREWDASRATAQADASACAASWRDAETALKAAIGFAREHGAVLPVAFSERA